jgi:Transglycosylase-like domain
MPVHSQRRSKPVVILSLVLFAICLAAPVAAGAALSSPVVSSVHHSEPALATPSAPVGPDTSYQELAFIHAAERSWHEWMSRLQRHSRRAPRPPRILRVAAPKPIPIWHPAPPRVAAPVPRKGHPNWYGVAQCESGQRWNYNGPSGFDGGLQFLPSTWTAVMRMSGYHFSSYAWQATAAQQIAAAEYLIGPAHANPWTQWPVCWRYA